MTQSALVVGGSNGIGLAIAKELTARGKRVYILDKAAPAMELGNSQYIACDLASIEPEIFERLAADETVDTLFITAGFGHVTRFEHLHTAQIERLITVNAIGVMKIVRMFYERILGPAPFYTGVMGSIAGMVSSPMFAVYAASKAALVRFVESVNIELAVAGTKNRILNVSPGHMQGTRFGGGENDLTALGGLAKTITDELLARGELLIPEYESTYKAVLDRYQTNPHEFGLSSYEHKLPRAIDKPTYRVGYLSGTFDLFHIGHLNLIRRAKQQCDTLIVGVHPDATHKRKEAFIPFAERKAIVGSIRYVDRVVDAAREDSDAWLKHGYHKLFVGSDYKETERFKRYEAFFQGKDVEIVYLPYTQCTSSTQIREDVKNSI